ncbi:MAG: hypothetical protein IPH18_11375 [Chitinophagaceae bacterium]|nr:hypothetical protein [Chitinophagaceae bacterium]
MKIFFEILFLAVAVVALFTNIAALSEYYKSKKNPGVKYLMRWTQFIVVSILSIVCIVQLLVKWMS